MLDLATSRPPRYFGSTAPSVPNIEIDGASDEGSVLRRCAKLNDLVVRGSLHARVTTALTVVWPFQAAETASFERGRSELLVADLGWTLDETAESHFRFRTFADDWDARGMEDYDDL